MSKYTIKNEEKGKREGIEVYEYKGKVEEYLTEMLCEIGFKISKKSRGYIRLNMVGIGDIVLHTSIDNANIYFSGLRQIKVNMFSGKWNGYVSYIYEHEKERKKEGDLL